MLKEKRKSCQLRILKPAKISFKHVSEIKRFSDKQKLTEFVFNRVKLQEINITRNSSEKEIYSKMQVDLNGGKKSPGKASGYYFFFVYSKKNV